MIIQNNNKNGQVTVRTQTFRKLELFSLERSDIGRFDKLP